jgi:hypothetical protein
VVAKVADDRLPPAVRRCYRGGMRDRLSAAQQEYDELEEMLLRRHPAFRLYLYAREESERAQHRGQLPADLEFRRWLALAAEITELVLRRG